jgi:hypothetical protein
MKPLVYVAGPYSSDPVVNTHEAVKFGMDLWDHGRCAVIIPHLSMFAHLVAPHDVDDWYAFDLDQLAHCHALFRLPGLSAGADREEAFAREHGIPVFNRAVDLGQWLARWEP